MTRLARFSQGVTVETISAGDGKNFPKAGDTVRSTPSLSLSQLGYCSQALCMHQS